MADRIFLSPPFVMADEAERLHEALESNWIAPVGPHIDAFEKELAEYVGCRDAAVLSSGTAAIHVALLAVGVASGDVVIAPSFTFVATLNPIRYVGADPWIVDSEVDTWNLDADLVCEAIEVALSEGRSVGAVISVDILGQCADYDRIEEVCATYDVPLIEDSAEALGSTYRGQRAGSFGRIGILSFNGNKIITTSGGGAVVSDDTELVARCRYLSTQARESGLHYEHKTVGYNYRMSNLLAALGRAQLGTIDERVSVRRAIHDKYESLLGGVDGIGFVREDEQARSNRWLTAITVDPLLFGATNADVISALEEENIEARRVWKPMHLQPLYGDSRVFGGSVSEAAFDTGACLPSGTQMTGDDVERVARIVRRAGSSPIRR